MELIRKCILTNYCLITAQRRAALEPTLERDAPVSEEPILKPGVEKEVGVGTLPSPAAAPLCPQASFWSSELKRQKRFQSPIPEPKHYHENSLQEKITHFNYLQNYAGICSGVHYNPVALQSSQPQS